MKFYLICEMFVKKHNLLKKYKIFKIYTKQPKPYKIYITRKEKKKKIHNQYQNN
jgi:hypothetical protein